MTDYKGYQTHIVDGQHIQYGADFVCAQRSLSVAFLTSIAQTWCTIYGGEMPPILEQSAGAYLAQTSECTEEIMRLAWTTPEPVERQNA